MNLTLASQTEVVFSSIEDVVADLKMGRAIILVDDETRENEGDIVIAADYITPEAITFMVRKAGGLVCLALDHDKVQSLELGLQPQRHLNDNQARFTVSIEAREGVTTGVSASDRAHTILTAVNNATTASDIATPGHVFPLMANEGGLKARQGHTEASIELARLAGCTPAAVICEIIREDGEMARGEDLQKFATVHNLKIARIDSLVSYIGENL